MEADLPPVAAREPSASRRSPSPGENQRFRVLNRAFIRAGVEMNSTREGTVEVGEEVEALESVQNSSGVVRVRFARGWVSAIGPDGSAILERIAGANKQRAAESREMLLSGKRPSQDSASPTDSTEAPPIAADDDTPVDPVVYKVLERALVRSEFELTSRRMGTVEPGERLAALELRDTPQGLTRVRFLRGWVAMIGGDGCRILEEILSEDYRPPQRGLLNAALTESLLDSDGRPKPLPVLGGGGAGEGGHAQAKNRRYSLLAAENSASAAADKSTNRAASGGGEGEGGALGAARLGQKVRAMELQATPSPTVLSPPAFPPPLLGEAAAGGGVPMMFHGMALFEPPKVLSAGPGYADPLVAAVEFGAQAVQQSSLTPLDTVPTRWPQPAGFVKAAGAAQAPVLSLQELSGPNASQAELQPDHHATGEMAAGVATKHVSSLRRALEEAGSQSGVEEYTSVNPCYSNALEVAICRREAPAVIDVLCRVFPSAAAEPLNGDTGQLPLHAACVSSRFWAPLVLPWSAGESLAGADENEPAIEPAAEEEDLAAGVIRALLTANPQAAQTADEAGQLPLHLAAKHSPSLELLQLLLRAYPEGAAQADKEGGLPLHLVFSRCALKPALAGTVKALVDAFGGAAEATDAKGRTPGQVGALAGAPAEVLRLVRKEEFLSSASQSLLG